ncbi:MAG: SAM-dependent methyltransferase [Nitrososphaerales archaeon]
MVPLISIIMWVLAGVMAYYFLGGFIWGAGYAPTDRKEIEKVARFLNLKEGKTFYDLGSGYGRMVITIAQNCNVNCIGVEMDPVKCWWTRFMIKRKKLEAKVKIIQSNILNVNLSEAENVFIFLSKTTDIMKRLREKMFREMKPGAHVVSYVHRFSDWPPEKVEGSLYLYSIPQEDKKDPRK